MKKIHIAALLISYCVRVVAGFDVVALGVKGGISSDNLTSYLLRPDDSEGYVALDAGSLFPGIEAGLAQDSFADVTKEKAAPFTRQGYIFREQIKAYFISHAHLDHVAGLILGSPEDTRKPLYTLSDSANTLRTHYFNWKSWPNFTDTGNGVRLGTYRIHIPRPAQRFTLGETEMSAVIYPLSHDGVTSSMILVSHQGESFAYFGDTGADVLEKGGALDKVWQVLGPLVQQHSLKGVIIECSYDNRQPDDQLYGHLKPKLLLAELQNLEKYSGGEGSLKGLPVVISHIKPSLKVVAEQASLIQQQLQQNNALGVKFMFMQQGEYAHFK